MPIVTGSQTQIRLIEGKRIHIASGVPLNDELGTTIERYCRAATVTMRAGEPNEAVLEVIGPSLEVVADLKEVRVISVCEHCKEEIKTRDVSALPDRVRKVEAA